MGVCTVLTGGDCVVLSPVVGVAVAAINNAIAGPGSQTLADYGQAVGEGFVTGGIGLICGGACGPAAIGAIDMTTAAAFGANDYLQGTQCASVLGALEASVIAAIALVAYPVDKEYYHFFMRQH
jgi:hypothetical protein